MCLVDHDQIEMPHPEAAGAVLHRIDQADHGRIGRDIDPSLGLLIGHQIHRRDMGQMRLERRDGLIHQRHAVRQKQHALHPAGTHELIDECDHGPGLPRAGRHDQQHLAQEVQLESVIDTTDAADLIEALNDGRIDRDRGERLAGRATQNQQLQLGLLEKPRDRTGRMTGVVPNPMFIAVGIEDDGPAAVHDIHTVRIELGLLLTRPRIALGALDLDDRQRPAVIAPEHIVDVALPLLVRHPDDRKLPVPCLIQWPAGLLEQHIDECIARLRFVVVVIVRDRLIGLFGGGDLGAQALDLRIQVVAFLLGLDPRGLGVLLSLGLFLECFGNGLQTSERLRLHQLRLGQSLGGELKTGWRLGACSVGMNQPIGKVEQLPQGHGRSILRHRAAVVHRAVTEILDQPRLGHQRIADQGAKGAFMDQRGQRVVVGTVQSPIMLVHPFDRRLQRESGIEAGTARIGQRQHLGPLRVLVDGLEFWLEEGELAHTSSLSSGFLGDSIRC